ncbi:MAG TPA: hypothetical protein VLN46_07290 [Gillisia sp.]|nr:hypothetical protein [Gillisia sp.]
MKKIVPLLFLLLAVICASAQNITRINVVGTVEMPEGEDPQGVSIFNLNSNRGTVSNATGQFNIAVTINDSISISSLQFQPFIVVVDQGIINTRQINIRLNEVLNLLPEVVVRPYDLTGNISVDINRLPVASVPDSLNALNTQAMYFEVDAAPNRYSPPRNEALAMSQTRLVNGINFVNLFREFLISTKIEQIQRPQSDIRVDVRALYNDEFFQENFNIELENIPDFINFADQNGLDEEMLKEGNEMDLIEFLLDQSKRFKKQQSQR